jgi:hypothetical protein
MNQPATEASSDSFPTLKEFERLQVDPESFDHAAHVYVGWELVTTYPLAEAIQRFSGTLKRLTRALNIEGKYHETITWFFMILIAERQSTIQAASWDSFVEASPDLLNDSKTLLASHYSTERLWSAQARTQFLLPDISGSDLT